MLWHRVFGRYRRYPSRDKPRGDHKPSRFHLVVHLLYERSKLMGGIGGLQFGEQPRSMPAENAVGPVDCLLQ